MATEGMRIFRKWNRIIHRDFGYFFFGMTLIYCISGIALNHKKDWNPNYVITTKEFNIGNKTVKADVSDEWVKAMLRKYTDELKFRKFYFRGENELKIFIQNGSVSIDLKSGNGWLEKLYRRPLLFELNFLHYNPGRWWIWFSDIFCVSMILIAISGLFIIAKSKNSLSRRGVWFIIAGLVIPVLALIFL